MSETTTCLGGVKQAVPVNAPYMVICWRRKRGVSETTADVGGAGRDQPMTPYMGICRLEKGRSLIHHTPGAWQNRLFWRTCHLWTWMKRGSSKPRPSCACHIISYMGIDGWRKGRIKKGALLQIGAARQGTPDGAYYMGGKSLIFHDLRGSTRSIAWSPDPGAINKCDTVYCPQGAGNVGGRACVSEW